MPDTTIHNANELEALAQRLGLLPFFACGIPNFSVEDFTPSRFWFVDGVDGPWEWRMEVACRGAVAYGKLFNKKAGLVSREWYPDLANYRRDGYDFDARYEDGLASYKEKCIVDVLLRDGPTLSKDLKKAAGFGGDGMKGFDTAITRLQMQTYVTVHSFSWCLAHRPLLYQNDWPLSFAMWASLFASVFTAIPVNPGSSDYYDSSVALADFQGRFSHSSHSRTWAALRFRAISV